MDDFDMACDTDLMIDDPMDDPTIDPIEDPMDDLCVDPGSAGDPTLYDLDGDGVADAVVMTGDDGETIVAVDADGDGLIDVVGVDRDGDGTVDATYIDADGDGVVDSVPPDLVTDTDGDGFTPGTVDTTPFDVVTDDPTVTDDDSDVHGDPMDDIEYHQAQPGPVDCEPTAIAMVVSEFTGETVPASEVVATANDLGVMTDQGMSAEDGVKLLEQYGVDAECTQGSLDDLRGALDGGQDVIVGLDSSDLYAQGGGPFDPGMQTGHAVEITGIDDEKGLVYINDPGLSDGAGVAIPISEFEDAWQDSDHTMITCTPPEDQPADTGDGLGSIVLPLTLRV